MKNPWQFTAHIMFTFAIISLPVIHFFTGSALAGNLASFVLSLHLILLVLGIFYSAVESRRANKGELTGNKLEKFLKNFEFRDELEKRLYTMSRIAFTVGMFVIAACGYAWFAGFILLLWLVYLASCSVARDVANSIRGNAKQAV